MAYNSHGPADPNLTDHPYSRNVDPQSHPRPSAPMSNVLSSEEIRVLKECNNESFYYRCLPLSLIFSGLAYFGIESGYLKKSVKYGRIPKMFGGICLGFILGKFSYRNQCAEKLMRLPNSKLAETLRRNKGIQSPYSGDDFNVGLRDAPMSFSTQSGYADNQFQSFDEGRDGYEKVTEDLRQYSGDVEPMLNKHQTGTVSYEELRKKNRESVNNKAQERGHFSPQPYFDSSNTGLPSHDNSHQSLARYPPSNYVPPPTSSGETSSPPLYFDRKKNKYGDVWDD